MSRQALAVFKFNMGYASDLAELDANGFMTKGSLNAMASGGNTTRPFKGLTLNEGIDGSRQYFLVDNSFAGLGTFSGSGQVGQGSIFKAKDLLVYIGSGKFKVKGVDSTLQASSTLSYIKRHASGEFIHFDGMSVLDSRHGQIGHGRPSKPVVFAKSPPSSGKKAMNASVTVAVWRVDSDTGQISNKSESSDIIQLVNGSVIVQLESADLNNQDKWGFGGSRLGLADLGNIYELPVEIGGEVDEATLAYQRTIASASIANSSAVVNFAVGTGGLTSADIGRRITIGAFSSYFIAVNTADQGVLFNENSGSSIVGAGAVIVHAIDGFTRAVELSWSDDDFLGQNLAPTDAFPPPAGRFAGAFFDIVYLEDLEGTLFYSMPDFLGSFPRSRRIITNDKATVYLEDSEGTAWRICKQSIGQVSYVGGEKPFDYTQKVVGHGCKYPANASMGHNGSVLIFSGTPIRIAEGESVDVDSFLPLLSEFEGWENQTADTPVVTAYDPKGHYELWCYTREIRAFHAPSGRWSSPIDITPYVPAGSKIVGRVIVNEQLYLAINDGISIKHYAFDVGTGSTMTIVSTGMEVQAEAANVSLYKATVKVDNDLTSLYEFFLIKDDVKTLPLLVGDFSPTVTPDIQRPFDYRPNVRGCKELAVKAVVTDADARLEIKSITLYGELSGVIQ